MTEKFDRTNMDARRWAKEFVRLNPGIDEDLMHTWFANAIMCGYDNHYWTTQEYKGLINSIMLGETKDIMEEKND